jgi:hypothetical protein
MPQWLLSSPDLQEDALDAALVGLLDILFQPLFAEQMPDHFDDESTRRDASPPACRIHRSSVRRDRPAVPSAG